jgi:hypothetical protein
MNRREGEGGGWASLVGTSVRGEATWGARAGRTCSTLPVCSRSDAGALPPSFSSSR